MADLREIAAHLGESLDERELGELAKMLADHLGVGSTHEREGRDRGRFGARYGRGMDAEFNPGTEGEQQLRSQGFFPDGGEEDGEDHEFRHHRDEHLRLENEAAEHDRRGDRRAAHDARKMASWHLGAAASSRRRRARDEPEPFPGRPRPGGEMDPLTRDRARRVVDRLRRVDDSAHGRAVLGELEQLLASDAAAASRPDREFALRYAGTSLIGTGRYRVTEDRGPTSTNGF
jgi:hypothetical protein